MTYDKFVGLFNDLADSEKISLYNEYENQCGDNNRVLYVFDEDFFDNVFSDGNKMEICRATLFGNLVWGDEYIGFDAYGNLKSFCERDAVKHVENSLQEIYKHRDIWEWYVH